MLERIVSPRELSHEFDDGSFDRGMAYFREGRVLKSKLETHGDHDVITGWVRGSGRREYEVHILVEAGPGGIVVDGDCSCPVGYNCKHVVSTLLDRLDNGPEPPAVQSTPWPLEQGGSVPEPALEQWLQRLENVARPRVAASYPSRQPNRLLYLLQPGHQAFSAGALLVEPVRCSQLKKGGYGKATPFSATRAWDPHRPDYLLPEDVAVLRRLAPEPFASMTGPLRLEGESGADALERLLHTGRCHWLDKDTPALTIGAPRPAAPEWDLGEDGLQRLVFRAEPPVTPARMSHHPPTAARDLPASTALRSGRVLNVVSATPPRPAGRAPCSHGHLTRLVTACGETCGLVCPTAPPWYIDLEQGTCGPLETDLKPVLAAALASAPAVKASQAPLVESLLKERLPGVSVPPPRRVEIAEIRCRPIPCLSLDKQSLSQEYEDPFFFQPRTLSFTTARLGFDYEGHRLQWGDSAEAPLVKGGDGLLRIRRDHGVEKQAYLRLVDAGLVRLSQITYGVWSEDDGVLVAESPGDEARFWLEFQQQIVPELKAAGWRVDIEESFPYSLVSPEEWYGDLDEEQGSGWFDLELGVVVDGRRVSLLPLLTDWLRFAAGRQQFEELLELPPDASMSVELEGGTFLSLPVGRVRAILENLLELYDPDVELTDGKLRLAAPRASQLADLEATADSAAGWRWLGGEQLRQRGERLRNFQGLAPVETPAGFEAALRQYQQEGLAWLQFLREYALGGVLADDMGLGKTVQTLAHLLVEKHSGRMDRPSLLVAPTSLMVNWRMEAQRFAPALRVLTLHGPDRHRHFDSLEDHDLVLTTYALLPRDREVLSAGEYHLLILDEAQNIKNPRAQVSQIVQQLPARHRLCLTGTPMENHLGELWSLFHFLQPGFLGEQRQFRRLFRTPIEKHRDDVRRGILSRRLAPLMLRRTKDEVAKDLPPKTEIERDVELQGAQRDLYESIRVAMHEKVRKTIARQGMDRSHIVILDALLKLRQVCCDPRLVNLDSARKVKTSAKLDLLMDLLPRMVEEGRRILLFSQFTTMLGLIEEEMGRRDLGYVKLTGRTRDRATPIAKFQAGEVPVFLISLKAGGTGLNLTAADTVIHYDPWWNPAVENQATDRAHRLGQDKSVFVYRLMTAGTVEEKIIALQARKRQLAEALFSEGGGGWGKLSSHDLEVLFEPLAGEP